MSVVSRVRCPYCDRGPLPAQTGWNLCSGCGEWFNTMDL